MPPAYPSRSRTARKEAGIETRPLASILFVNVETKRSIPRFEPRPRRELRLRAALLEPALNSHPTTGGAVAVDRIWALSPDQRHTTDPYPVRSGTYGISWKFMGVNGSLTI